MTIVRYMLYSSYAHRDGSDRANRRSATAETNGKRCGIAIGCKAGRPICPFALRIQGQEGRLNVARNTSQWVE